MILLEQVWKCEECDEIFTTTSQTGKPRSPDAIIVPKGDQGTVPGAVKVCIDFAGTGNPWIYMCPKCVRRLEMVWPKLIEKFRGMAKAVEERFPR